MRKRLPRKGACKGVIHRQALSTTTIHIQAPPMTTTTTPTPALPTTTITIPTPALLITMEATMATMTMATMTTDTMTITTPTITIAHHLLSSISICTTTITPLKMISKISKMMWMLPSKGPF